MGRHKYFFIMLLLIFLSPLKLVMADDQLAVILEGIRNNYGPLPGLNVPYEREIISKSMALLGDKMKRDLATGRIYFKPPHFLKVKQETPNLEEVITDGDTLWWYIPHKKQVYRYPSHKLGQELRLLGDIFQGLREVEESFEVILEDGDNERKHRLRLTPNPPWQQIDYINLSVDKGDYPIRMVEIHNYLGSITIFTLDDFAVQETFEEGFFRFVAPEGVKVIEEDN